MFQIDKLHEIESPFKHVISYNPFCSSLRIPIFVWGFFKDWYFESN